MSGSKAGSWPMRMASETTAGDYVSVDLNLDNGRTGKLVASHREGIGGTWCLGFASKSGREDVYVAPTTPVSVRPRCKARVNHGDYRMFVDGQCENPATSSGLCKVHDPVIGVRARARRRGIERAAKSTAAHELARRLIADIGAGTADYSAGGTGYTGGVVLNVVEAEALVRRIKFLEGRLTEVGEFDAIAAAKGGCA